MNDEKEKWMEEVFQSMKGSQRASPRPSLLEEIENKLINSKAKVVPMSQWKYASIAATLILLINVSALLYFNQNKSISYEDTSVVDSYNQSIISTYQIYE